MYLMLNVFSECMTVDATHSAFKGFRSVLVLVFFKRLKPFLIVERVYCTSEWLVDLKNVLKVI